MRGFFAALRMTKATTGILRCAQNDKGNDGDNDGDSGFARMTSKSFQAKRANMGESMGRVWVGPPMRPEALSRRKMVMEAES